MIYVCFVRFALLLFFERSLHFREFHSTKCWCSFYFQAGLVGFVRWLTGLDSFTIMSRLSSTLSLFSLSLSLSFHIPFQHIPSTVRNFFTFSMSVIHLIHARSISIPYTYHTLYLETLTFLKIFDIVFFFLSSCFRNISIHSSKCRNYVVHHT